MTHQGWVGVSVVGGKGVGVSVVGGKGGGCVCGGREGGWVCRGVVRMYSVLVGESARVSVCYDAAPQQDPPSLLLSAGPSHHAPLPSRPPRCPEGGAGQGDTHADRV